MKRLQQSIYQASQKVHEEIPEVERAKCSETLSVQEEQEGSIEVKNPTNTTMEEPPIAREPEISEVVSPTLEASKHEDFKVDSLPIILEDTKARPIEERFDLDEQGTPKVENQVDLNLIPKSVQVKLPCSLNTWKLIPTMMILKR